MKVLPVGILIQGDRIMKKLISVLLCLFSFSIVFSEERIFKVGERIDWWKTPSFDGDCNVFIDEIFPMSDTVVKVAYSTGKTEYIKKGDIFFYDRHIIDEPFYDELTCVVKNWDYNIIQFEVHRKHIKNTYDRSKNPNYDR